MAVNEVSMQEEMLIWEDLMKKGMTNSINGLSKMVGKEFQINSIKIRKVPAKEMPYVLGGPEHMVIGVYITFSGASHGHILLAHQPEFAYKVLDMLMGNPMGTTSSLDEMSQSALGEMGNITGTFFLNAVADELGVFLNPSPPIVLLDMAGAILDIALAEILAERDDVFIAETSFGVTDRTVEGTFLIMPNASFMQLPLVNSRGGK
ncbi:MAG: chemotaxis protein CheX [Chloroflexi bacterium]|nr:chemotaxis protein CheX [Chloroflexota bacterium]